MTQTHTPAPPLAPAIAWRQALQAKLMAAIDAAWALIEHSDDPADIRRARERAKAVGEIAAMARKVVMFGPAEKAAPSADLAAQAERLARVMAPGLAAEVLTAAHSPAAQAEHSRRALKLKGGGRARL